MRNHQGLFFKVVRAYAFTPQDQEDLFQEIATQVWLYEQIRQLNEIDRSLTLLLLDGFSYKEMAAILGITENYVGVKIDRIKGHLTGKSREEVSGGV